MNKRTARLLHEIEQGSQDSRSSISDLLRKVIALGGAAGSAEMRNWATRELRGYTDPDDLPEYRKIAAPLLVDFVTMRAIMTGQQISSVMLPEAVKGTITEDLNLIMPISEIEKLAGGSRDEPVRIQPRYAAEVVLLMNQSGRFNGQVQRLYWGITHEKLEAVVEQVRTTPSLSWWGRSCTSWATVWMTSPRRSRRTRSTSR